MPATYTMQHEHMLTHTHTHYTHMLHVTRYTHVCMYTWTAHGDTHMPYTQSRTRTRQYTIYPYSDPKPILLELLFPLLPFPHPLFLFLLILLILLLLLLLHSPMTNEEKQQQQQQQPHHQPVNVTRIPLSQSLSLSLFPRLLI